jgi:chromosomal replication initiator protein
VSVENFYQPRIPRVSEIQAVVCERFGLPLIEMSSRRRARGVARPRQVAMYLARELTRLSLPEIGRRFGNKDHTTVLHACRTVPVLAAHDPEFADVLAELRRSILGDPLQLYLRLA